MTGTGLNHANVRCVCEINHGYTHTDKRLHPRSSTAGPLCMVIGSEYFIALEISENLSANLFHFLGKLHHKFTNIRN